MTVFDIILLALLAWALYSGFRAGVAVELGGIAGLFIGAYLAFRYGNTVGSWVGADQSLRTVVGFIIVFVVALVAIALLSRLLRGIFRFAGLRLLDQLGGALLSLLKAGLVSGLLLYGFDFLNRETGWVEQATIEKSRLYRPMVELADKTFPYVDFVKGRLLDGDE